MLASLAAALAAAAAAPTPGTARLSAAASAAAATGLRAQYFSNGVLLGSPACTAISPTPASLRIDAHALKALCGGSLSSELFSARFHGQLQLPPVRSHGNSRPFLGICRQFLVTSSDLWVVFRSF